MNASDTVVTLLIGAAGVGVAALADHFGVPTVLSSLVGLVVVLGLIFIRRAFRT